MVLFFPYMRQYELMLVFRPDFDTKDVKARDEVIHKLIGTFKMKDVMDMGKKRLAYPIQKIGEGNYVVAQVEGDAMNIGDMEKQSRLQTDVIRYLLTVKKG